MKDARIVSFLRFSSEITGFKVIELRGTGESDEYLATVDRIASPKLVDELLEKYAALEEETGAQREQAMRRTIFGNERIGPIARNVIKLWYVGIWYQLPKGWRDAYGAREEDVTFTVSPNAYTQGLLWPAIGANPAGAKAPGYGSWAAPPKIPHF